MNSSDLSILKTQLLKLDKELHKAILLSNQNFKLDPNSCCHCKCYYDLDKECCNCEDKRKYKHG